ncbi:LuxR C-terminal-related transcriptional regulator [Glycomyces sp. L485]|uniref:response regulator transcription factor n=1 Tax=Glycomyces sp. L485 TaxID=2909235 RepID=UPI001F4BBCE3|nr:LuxR C-terminal-related transcriptional regulator [Glycomyces sp. L485]MCH7229841.1 LuxR C-terminal-related transcriptional regulator [Glycomyces sp. L485]
MPGSQYPDLDPIEHITPRQRQILIHLVRGKTRDAIARELFLSRSTVNRDIRDMSDTLGAPSAEALGALAYRAGILSEEHLRASSKASADLDKDGLLAPDRLVS